MKKFRLLFYIASVAVFLGSCTGKDGAPGATGPAGTNGTNGTANITTTTYTITTSQWVSHSNWYSAALSVPALTDSNTDVVMVYVSKTSGLYSGEWYGLPLPNFLVTGDGVNYTYGNKQMSFGYNYSSAPSQTLNFKVCVIPPAVIKSHPNTNWKNYNEVSALMNL